MSANDTILTTSSSQKSGIEYHNADDIVTQNKCLARVLYLSAFGLAVRD
jgi:hypothetical protein